MLESINYSAHNRLKFVKIDEEMKENCCQAFNDKNHSINVPKRVLRREVKLSIVLVFCFLRLTCQSVSQLVLLEPACIQIFTTMHSTKGVHKEPEYQAADLRPCLGIMEMSIKHIYSDYRIIQYDI